jgi:hypothetical protein
VFEAKSTSGPDHDNGALLSQLTLKARASGLKVDKSALAYNKNGSIVFYGTPDLVKYLSNLGVPRWTHTVDA